MDIYRREPDYLAENAIKEYLPKYTKLMKTNCIIFISIAILSIVLCIVVARTTAVAYIAVMLICVGSGTGAQYCFAKYKVAKEYMKLRNQVLISDIKSVGSLSFVCNTTNSILFALRLLVQTNNLEDYEIYNDVFVKKTSYKVTQADYDRFNLVNNEKIGDTVILTLINHKCPNCGSNILDNTKKCPYCDTKFY